MSDTINATSSVLQQDSSSISESPGDITLKATSNTRIDQVGLDGSKQMGALTETRKVSKASVLKEAIIALLQKIMNFLQGASQQSSTKNNAECTKLLAQVAILQAELNERRAKLQQALEKITQLENNSPADVTPNVPVVPNKDTNEIEALKKQLAVAMQEIEDLTKQLAEAQQKLAEFSTGGAQKSERNLMQLLDSAQFTFIESDLFSLMRNELPVQGSGVPAPSDPNGIPVPPPPPPPPAPNGVPVPPPPPPPPAPGTVNPISIKKAKPKAGPNFLDVVAKCRKFVENGYQIGDTIIHSEKEFNEQKRRLDAEIRERKVDNDQNLNLMEGFKEKIKNELHKWLGTLSESECSTKITLKEGSDLEKRYNDLNLELFMRDADQLKALGLMNDATYARLTSIRDEMETKKEDFTKQLGIYLEEQKSIEAREREINSFKLPLPNANTAPYLNEVLQLLALKEKLDGHPEEQKKIEALLSKDLTQEVQETLDKNQARIAELESLIKQKQSELESQIDTLRQDSKYASVTEMYDKGNLQAMFLNLKKIGGDTYKILNQKSNDIRKFEQEKESLSISIKSELQKAIREANTVLRKAKETMK